MADDIKGTGDESNKITPTSKNLPFKKNTPKDKNANELQEAIDTIKKSFGWVSGLFSSNKKPEDQKVEKQKNIPAPIAAENSLKTEVPKKKNDSEEGDTDSDSKPTSSSGSSGSSGGSNSASSTQGSRPANTEGDAKLGNRENTTAPTKRDEIQNSNDLSDAKKSSLADKFKKELKKPKSLEEIKKEAEEKIKAQEGKKFTESDAVKFEQNINDQGFQKGYNINDKIEKAKKGKLFVIRGKDKGRPAWHYILVPRDKISMLNRQKSGETIDITKFGEVIKGPDGEPCSGWGEDPPADLQKWVEKEYD